ncbi:hypothetical protein D3C80_1826100 [compost metagenome]
MQGVVHAGDHAGGVAEGRMLGDVLHALAIDPHFAAVVQAFQIFLPGERDEIFIYGLLGSSQAEFGSVDSHFIRTASAKIQMGRSLDRSSKYPFAICQPKTDSGFAVAQVLKARLINVE